MANIAANLKDWSATAGSNQPDAADAATVQADLQQLQATIRQDLATIGANIASATTTDLGAVAGLAHHITGTTTITGFGTVSAGIAKLLVFDGALTLTHNATSLKLPGGANITTAANDRAYVVSEGSGNWNCWYYTKAASIAATLAGTETLSNKTLSAPVLTGGLTTTDNSAINVGSGAISGGAISGTGDFAIATNKFTVASASGNTVVAGTLGVTGAITASGDLNIATATTAILRFGGANVLQRTAATGDLVLATGGAKLSITGLPTSSAGLSSGNIWLNSNVLTIVP